MSDETTPDEIPAEDAEEMSPEEVVEFTPEESEPVTEEEVLDSGFPTLEQLAALLPQYEFHDILGVGGMGAVYLARQAALDRWVAIKLLPQSASLNAEDASRFITEQLCQRASWKLGLEIKRLSTQRSFRITAVMATLKGLPRLSMRW